MGEESWCIPTKVEDAPPSVGTIQTHEVPGGGGTELSVGRPKRSAGLEAFSISDGPKRHIGNGSIWHGEIEGRVGAVGNSALNPTI